jgi:hypothetical protein
MEHTYSKDYCQPCDDAYRSYACVIAPSPTDPVAVQEFAESLNYRWSQGGYYIHDTYGAMAPEVMAFFYNVVQQQMVEARQDENRRSGGFWGGLAPRERLHQGMEYMSRRESELAALNHQVKPNKNGE